MRVGLRGKFARMVPSSTADLRILGGKDANFVNGL